MSAQGLSHPTPSHPKELSVGKAVASTQGCGTPASPSSSEKGTAWSLCSASLTPYRTVVSCSWRSWSSLLPHRTVCALLGFACPRLGKAQLGSPITCQGQTLVVFTLLPLLQLHPERSGSTLHSSPWRHGSIWHHHFCSTMEAGETREGISGCDTRRYSPSVQHSSHQAALAKELLVTCLASPDTTAPPASRTPCLLSLPQEKEPSVLTPSESSAVQ